jgi:hypothetical protein
VVAVWFCAVQATLLHELSQIQQRIAILAEEDFFTKKWFPATGFVLDTQNKRAKLKKKKLDELVFDWRHLQEHLWPSLRRNQCA